MSTPCQHCGHPARPRTGAHGFAPRTCDGCRHRRQLERNRRLRAKWRAEDPQGYLACNAIKLRAWRERRREMGRG